MTPRVGFCSPLWAKGPRIALGWSDYWRLAIPAVALSRQGWDVALVRALAPGHSGRFMVRNEEGHWRDDLDVIVFHRWISDTAPELIEEARAAGQVIVNDLDDDFWSFPSDHPGAELTSPARDPSYNRDNYRKTISASSVITVSTPALVDVVRDWGPEVRVVPNYIGLDAWPQRDPGRYIGWVGTTAGRAHDLAILRESVVPWMRDRGLTFYHGGALHDEPKMKDVLGYDNVIVRQAVDPLRYPQLWDPLRIALCPLGDHPFSRAKSWVKPLQACARGVPFIASSHPEYQALGTGRLVAEPADWQAHLSALGQPGAYQSDVVVNRRRVEGLSIKTGWRAWAQLLEDSVEHQEESNVVVA